MSEKNPFADLNPFLGLCKKSFPRRVSQNPARKENKQQEQEDACETAQDEESRLFLQAVRALPLKKQPLCNTLGVTPIKANPAMPRSLSVASEKPALPLVVPAQPDQLLATKFFPASRHAQACDTYGMELLAADEHAAVFAQAMRDVLPLKNTGRDVPLGSEPPAIIAPQQQSFQELLENTLEFALSFSEEYIEGHVVGLESLILQKLRAGQYSPEAHLDLHGLNARQAFDALVGFVRHSWYKGMRTVLLIPGRGKNSPEGVAVLRERVQAWLTQEPFKRVVLAFCTAKPIHGGPGSLYVLLRKYKKKGRVYWERCPADMDL